MTDELTKTFFDAFGIEPDITSCYHRCNKDLDCKECNEAKVIYPQITDRILLELICILSNKLTYVILACNTEELKNYVLESCIKYSEHIIYQVRKLFEEGNNDR